jgi:hypothetical protein
MSDLETVARWLGPEYVAITRSGAVTIHRKQTYSYAGCPPLDEDQELGAILRRARELGMFVSLYDWADGDGKRAYSFVLEDCDSDLEEYPSHCGRDPLPHLAARAAVCKLMEAQK